MNSVTTFDILDTLVKKITCKPEWWFSIEKNSDLHWRLRILVRSHNADNERTMISVSHSFPVPIAEYNEKTWRRWVFECCRGVENHELGEWFKVDGERPFAPLHGPGENPYMIHEFRPEIDARTNQAGIVEDKD